MGLVHVALVFFRQRALFLTVGARDIVVHALLERLQINLVDAAGTGEIERVCGGGAHGDAGTHHAHAGERRIVSVDAAPGRDDIVGLRRHEALTPWSDEECALVLRLHGEGASWAAIAEAVPGRSAIAVFRKLRHLVGPAPFKAACQPKPVVVAKAKRPTPPASVPAGVDAVVRWLRSRDFMVLRLESGWRVDHRVLATTEALLDFVNVRRGWLHLPPFALTATDCGEEPVAVPRLVTGKGPKRFGAMPIRFHPGRR